MAQSCHGLWKNLTYHSCGGWNDTCRCKTIESSVMYKERCSYLKSFGMLEAHWAHSLKNALRHVSLPNAETKVKPAPSTNGWEPILATQKTLPTLKLQKKGIPSPCIPQKAQKVAGASMTLCTHSLHAKAWVSKSAQEHREETTVEALTSLVRMKCVAENIGKSLWKSTGTDGWNPVSRQLLLQTSLPLCSFWEMRKASQLQAFLAPHSVYAQPMFQCAV